MKEKEVNVRRLIAEDITCKAQGLFRLRNVFIEVVNYCNRSRIRIEEMRVRLKNFLHWREITVVRDRELLAEY